MATSTYGIIREADVNPADIEILYTYSVSRNELPSSVRTLSNQNIQQLSYLPQNALNTRVLPGLYNLSLPKDLFGVKGFYNILIRAKEYETTIADCGVLAGDPNIRGLVLDTGNPELADLVERFSNGGTNGFRIEYLDENNNKIANLFRIITSSNRCEAVTLNLTNNNDKAVRYRLNENGTLVFLTLTPSSVSSVKPNTRPFLGIPNQRIIISNTYFDPIHLEIEMTDVTLDTIGDILIGNRAKSANGIITYYDRTNNDIKYQFDAFVIKDQTTQESLYEVRERKTDIDTSQDFNTVKTFEEENIVTPN